MGKYYDEFTEENQELLKKFDLSDKNMVKDDDVTPISEKIEWTQTMRCLTGCEEEYLLVDYYEDGEKTNPVMKVFVARAFGDPPQQFSTGGHEGNLFFGYLKVDDEKQAIYFVLHPSDWYPFQNRFRTNSTLESFKDGLSNVAGMVGVGGDMAGKVLDFAMDSLVGDYLRYIG